jgi:hypothetical protein
LLIRSALAGDLAVLLAVPVHPVGAENRVTLCDLGVFADQAAEPVPDAQGTSRRLCSVLYKMHEQV